MVRDDGVIVRQAARVLMLDAAGRVLLFCGTDLTQPELGEWWFTPGGGVEPGESLEQAARREVFEETGRRLSGDLGPVVLSLTAEFVFEGRRYSQHEHYFRVRVPDDRVDYSGWTETERRVVRTHHWWTTDELAASSETFYPVNLIEFLTRG